MKKLFMLAVCAAAFLACDKEAPVVETPAESSEVKILAYAPGVDYTKSVIDGYKVLWEDGDEILMCLTPKTSQYSSAEQHATSVFTTRLAETSGKAYFVGTNAYTSYYQQNSIFIYPSTVEYSASRSGSTVSESIKFALPSEQVAGENGSFGTGYNLSSAFVNATGFNNGGVPETTFKNSCALIRFVLPQSAADARSVTVTSASPLAGYASLYKSEVKNDRYEMVGYDLSYNGSLDNNTSVTLTNDGAAFVPGVEYNIVVWPGTHSDLTFKFVDSNGLICEKKVGRTVELKENEIDHFNFKSAFVFAEEKVPSLEVSTTSLSVNSKGDAVTFDIEANNDWTVTSDQSWLTVSPSSTSQVSVTATTNNTSSARTATVTVSSATLTKSVTVTQAAATYRVKGSAVQNAADLKDGGLYVIHKKNSSLYLTESDNAMAMSTHSTSDTFYSLNVFEFNRDDSYKQTFDTNYQSNCGGTLKSISNGKYLTPGMDLKFTSELSGAQYLSVANRWRNPNYPYTTDAPGDMDVYKAGADGISMWFASNYFTFANAGHDGDVNNRKWVFYEVTLQ